MVILIALAVALFGPAFAAEQPPDFYPLCPERSQAQEFIKAALAHDQRWINAIGCPRRPAGDVVVIESGFDVVKVRVLQPDGGSAVGYTINWKNALP
jgi:hypothetical protein